MNNYAEKIEKINKISQNTLIETLNIVFTECDENTLKATMPVNSVVHQPFGYLHGGASIALAETLGSYLSFLHVDTEQYNVFGLEVAANHLRAKKSGLLTGTATLRHKGRTTHLVQIDIVDEENKLVCAVKMTNIVVKKEK